MNSVLGVLPFSAFGCWLVIWLVFQMMLLCILIVHTMTMFGINRKYGPVTVDKMDHIYAVGCGLWWVQSWGWAALIVGGYDQVLYQILFFVLFGCFVAGMVAYGKFVFRSNLSTVVAWAHNEDPLGPPTGLLDASASRKPALDAGIVAPGTVNTTPRQPPLPTSQIAAGSMEMDSAMDMS